MNCFQHGPRPPALPHALVSMLLASSFLFPAPLAVAGKGPFDWAQLRLDEARNDKLSQLEQFCERIHMLAREAAADEQVAAFFTVNRLYAAAITSGAMPEGLAEKVAALRSEFNAYYIKRYFAFHDILFVDMEGTVFYTIRKESEFHNSLLAANTSPTPLTEGLRQLPEEEVFIDFHHYTPSAEAAAFFVEPMRKEGVPVGWLVLQCAVNKVNSIFAWTEDLGATGESFLVNEEGYMLTESNFEGNSTILKKKLDDRNIKAKFAEGQGQRRVTDYRGRKALTSFDVFEFLGARWLVVAKMDQDEIITRHYTRHAHYYADHFREWLEHSVPPPLDEAPVRNRRHSHKVDMDEYLKAEHEECLETFGVSTCTALIATFPGKFAYLAHISRKDRIYGGSDANLLGQMIKRITTFDIYPSEKRRLHFYIVAPHHTALFHITETLIEKGFLLSQFNLICNPTANSANLTYDYSSNDLNITWKTDSPVSLKNTHQREDLINMGQALEKIMLLEKEIAEP